MYMNRETLIPIIAKKAQEDWQYRNITFWQYSIYRMPNIPTIRQKRRKRNWWNSSSGTDSADTTDFTVLFFDKCLSNLTNNYKIEVSFSGRIWYAKNSYYANRMTACLGGYD